MRILKILAVTLVSVLVLLIAGAVLLVVLFDPNDYKEELTALLEDRTGRAIEINDDIEWTLFPWLAIETGGITIGNHPDFGDRPFAAIETLSARVRVWPLLRREIELGLISIDGFELNPEIDAAGNSNWADLTAAATTPAPAAGAGGPDRGGIASLRIEGVRIRGGRILWREGDAVSYVISDAAIATGPITLGEPVTIEADLSLLEVATQRNFSLNLETTAALEDGAAQLSALSGELMLRDTNGEQRAQARFASESLTILGGARAQAGPGSIEGSLLRPPVGPDEIEGRIAWPALEIDLSAGTAELQGITATLNGITADLQLTGENLAATPTLRGTVTLRPAAAANLITLAGIDPPAGIDPAQLGEVSGRARFVVTPGAASELPEVQLDLLGASLTAQARIAANGTIDAAVTVPRFAPNNVLRSLLTAYLPAAADLSVVQTAGGSATIRTDGTGATAINPFELRINEATLSGSVALVPGGAGTVYSGTMNATEVDPILLSALLGENLAEGIEPEAIGRSRANATFTFDAAADTLTLGSFAVGAFGLSADGNLTVNSLRSAPVARGRAAVQTFNPRTTLLRLGQPVPQTSDAAAFQSAALTGNFVIDSAHGEFRDLTVVLDNSPITGFIRIDDFSSPSYEFDLRTATLDVDRYLPPDSDAAEDGERTAGDIELANEPLERLALTGIARVGDLTLSGLRFQQVEATLTIGDGRARIEPARAQLYGGTFNGALTVDTGAEVAAMQLTGQATNVALDPLISALVGDSDIRGTGNFDLDLQGSGATVTDTLQTAAGTMSFSLTDGALSGFNLGRTLCAAYNLREKLPRPANAPDETRFQLIRAAADVSDGIAVSNGLLARTDFMDVTGNGRMNLADARLDYDMTAALTAAVPIAGCETMDEFVGDSIPFTIDGPLGDPSIEVDLRRLVRSRVQEEIRDSVRERLQDRVRDLL